MQRNSRSSQAAGGAASPLLLLPLHIQPFLSFTLTFTGEGEESDLLSFVS